MDRIQQIIESEHRRMLKYAYGFNDKQVDEYIEQEHLKFVRELAENKAIREKYGSISARDNIKRYPVKQTSLSEIYRNLDSEYFLNYTEKPEISVPENEILHYIAYRYSVKGVDISVNKIVGNFIEICTTYRDEGCSEYDTPFYVEIENGFIKRIIVRPDDDFLVSIGYDINAW